MYLARDFFKRKTKLKFRDKRKNTTYIMDCVICCETKSKFVSCPCEFEACMDCTKKYIFKENSKAKCMSCARVWTPRFMYTNFEKTFQKKYKEHVTRVLHAREMSLLPGTRARAAAVQRSEEAKKQLKQARTRIERLEHQVYFTDNSTAEDREELIALYKQLPMLRNGAGNIPEVTQYTCPIPTCKGYLGEDWRCTLCNSRACSECREIENGTRHVCDKDVLETIAALKKDSKPCPRCTTMISKTVGCNQIFCIVCKVIFDWNTLRIQTSGARHNPELVEYERRNNLESTTLNSVFVCGRTLDMNLVRRLGGSYLDLVNNLLYMYNGAMYNLATSDTIELNSDTRVGYILGKINEVSFKRRIVQRDKAVEKDKELRNIVNFVVGAITDELYIIANNPGHTDIVFGRINGILDLANTELKIMSGMFECKPYIITQTFRLVRDTK